MSVLLFLSLIIVVGLALVLIPVVVSSLGSKGGRAELREARQKLLAERQRTKIATAALRSIADPTVGNPSLEACNALDAIESTYTKELN